MPAYAARSTGPARTAVPAAPTVLTRHRGVRTGYAAATGTAAPTHTAGTARATDAHNPATGTAVATSAAVTARSPVSSRIASCGAGASGQTNQAVPAITTGSTGTDDQAATTTCTPSAAVTTGTALSARAAGTDGRYRARIASGTAVAAQAKAAARTTRTTVTANAPPQQPRVATGTTSTTRAHSGRRLTTGTAIASVAQEQTTGATIAPGATSKTGYSRAPVAAIPEPPRRTAVATVVAVSAVAEQTSVTAGARSRTGAGLGCPRIPVSNQNSAIGMLGGSVAEEETPHTTRARTCGRTRRGGRRNSGSRTVRGQPEIHRVAVASGRDGGRGWLTASNPVATRKPQHSPGQRIAQPRPVRTNRVSVPQPEP